MATTTHNKNSNMVHAVQGMFMQYKAYVMSMLNAGSTVRQIATTEQWVKAGMPYSAAEAKEGCYKCSCAACQARHKAFLAVHG